MATVRFSVILKTFSAPPADSLGRLGGGKLRVELFELCDQLVDPLAGVLASLIRFDQLCLQTPDLLIALTE
jgi:hypothetical protein